MCQKYSDRPAIIYLGETWTYAEMKELIDRFAKALYSLGVGHGDRVMLYIPNSPQFIAGFLGSMKIGAAPVPVSPIYTPHEIQYLINDSGAVYILCQDTNFGYVKEVFPNTGLKGIIVTNYADLLPWWKRTVGTLFDKIPHGVVEKGKRSIASKNLLKNIPPPSPTWISIQERTLAAYLYGWNHGLSKRCSDESHGRGKFCQRNSSNQQRLCWRRGEDRLIMINPLFHEMAQG